MKDIQDLSDDIGDEIDDAEKYARKALDKQESSPEIAELYASLAAEELGHMTRLHDMVKKVIDTWKKETGKEPSPDMQARYDILHKIHKGEATKARLMLQLYKEAK